MDSKLVNACAGKSASKGGLNVKDLVKLAKQGGYKGNGRRADLLAFLCNGASKPVAKKPSPGARALAPQPAPAAVNTKKSMTQAKVRKLADIGINFTIDAIQGESDEYMWEVFAQTGINKYVPDGWPQELQDAYFKALPKFAYAKGIEGEVRRLVGSVDPLLDPEEMLNFKRSIALWIGDITNGPNGSWIGSMPRGDGRFDFEFLKMVVGEYTLMGGPGVPKVAHKLAQTSKPKTPPAPIPAPAPMVKVTKTKTHGIKGRLSAKTYYDTHGQESAVGHVCDIRGDGELKCLLLDKNGRPRWAKVSKSGKGQEPCGQVPWKSKCNEQM